MRIIKILSTKQIIMNAGENENIKVGDRFQILDKEGSSPVIDPETQENLGTLDIIKATVKATIVYPKMTVLESEEQYNPLLQMNNPYSSILKNANRNISKDLKVDPNEITGGIAEKSNAPIKIGDKVRKLSK